MTEYKSKTLTVNRSQKELFPTLTDLESIKAALPADKAAMVDISGDSISVNYSGVSLTIRISEKTEFSSVVFSDVNAPFHFNVHFHLDDAPLVTQTNLWISVEADLNFMMKALLGSKIQEGLDNVVTAIATGIIPQ